MGYIFVSYSHQDRKYVHSLADNLEQEGFNVWIDDRLDYGTDWPVEIQQRLDSCDALILVMSTRSLTSKWVQNELNRALRKKKPIFPLLLEGNEPWLSVESTQYVDVTNERMPEEKFYGRLERVTPRHKKTIEDEIPPLDKGHVQPQNLPSESSKVSSTQKAAPPEQQKKTVFKGWKLPVAILSFFCILTMLGTSLFGVPKLVKLLTSAKTPTIPYTIPRGPSPSKTNTTAQSTVGRKTPAFTRTFTPAASNTSTEEATPVLPAINIIKQFDAPGISHGIAWDGQNLWVSEGDFAESIKLMKLDENGTTINVYVSDILNEVTSMDNGDSIVWVNGSLWLSERDGVHEVKFDGDRISQTVKWPQAFTIFDRITTRVYTFTWDEQNFWAAEDYFLFKMSPDGSIQNNIVYPYDIIGMAWDGNNLWLSSAAKLWHAEPTLDIWDGYGKALVRFPSPLSCATSLTWDGTYLWALGCGKISQLDVGEALQYAATQAELRARSPALYDTLSLAPSSEPEEANRYRVEIVNNTGLVLKVSFEEYNYSVEVEPAGSKVITVPGNVFTAEVPGLLPLQGEWSFEPWAKYTYLWTFIIK